MKRNSRIIRLLFKIYILFVVINELGFSTYFNIRIPIYSIELFTSIVILFFANKIKITKKWGMVVLFFFMYVSSLSVTYILNQFPTREYIEEIFYVTLQIMRILVIFNNTIDRCYIVKNLQKSYVFILFFSLVIGLLDHFRIINIFDYYNKVRLLSFSGNPNQLGISLVIAIYLLIFSKTLFKKTIKIFLSGFFLYCSILTGSRGVSIILLISIIILLVNKLKKQNYFKITRALTIIIAFILILLFINISFPDILANTMDFRSFNFLDDSSQIKDNGRIEALVINLKEFEKHPFFGVGFSEEILLPAHNQIVYFYKVSGIFIGTVFLLLNAWIFSNINMRNIILLITVFLIFMQTHTIYMEIGYLLLIYLGQRSEKDIVKRTEIF